MEASWDGNWKDEVKISKVEARLGQRRQDRSKRSEEEARITKRRGKLRSEIEAGGSPRSWGAAVTGPCKLRIRNFRKQI